MEVILIQDVDNLGSANEKVKVKSQADDQPDGKR